MGPQMPSDWCVHPDHRLHHFQPLRLWKRWKLQSPRPPWQHETCSTGGVGMVGHTPHLDVIDVGDCSSPRHLILMWRKIPCKKASQTVSRTSLLVSLQKQTAKDMHKKRHRHESYPLHLVHLLQTPEGLNHCAREKNMLNLNQPSCTVFWLTRRHCTLFRSNCSTWSCQKKTNLP